MSKETFLFDPLAKTYDAWFETQGRLIFASEVVALRSLMPLPAPRPEVGVGSGRFAEALGAGIGLDPSVKLLRIAKGRGIQPVQGVGESPPFRDGGFGTVFLIVTL